ncbi:hypothetical protein [Rhodococcus sp. 114MFTsu3.1]|uniref:hypothetical protein n=1 Tax=Rhodococcus sp. 114MFTsu3.1 TaxID=1172184 RepID=UPI00117A508B|nr:MULTISPECIES: hypothetical protein [unclassified Rhodococcus (in: high G+C Gram-positive bacteria)]
MITGTIIDSTGSYPDEPTDVGVTPIDVTVRNSGGEPSLISQINAEVLFAETLSDCTFGGAGPALVSANYSVKLPTDANTGGTRLGTTSTETRFEVKAGAVDRMVVTIGPEKQQASGSYPVVVAVRLSLVHDNNETLDAGAVSIVSTLDNAEKQVQGKLDPDCAAKNLQVLDKLFAVQSIRSNELERLRAAYARSAE